jgi:ribonuclease T1
VKRTGLHGCMAALFCLALSGCGNSEHGSASKDAAVGASAAIQPEGRPNVASGENPGDGGREARNDAGSNARNEARPGAAGVGRDATGDSIGIAQLPKQAVVTLRRIEAGGPFPFEKDGIVFGNREHLLPPQPRGFYHEYTVPTPRARNRGAHRIVCGGPRRQIDYCFYSDDHYVSFKRIAG